VRLNSYASARERATRSSQPFFVLSYGKRYSIVFEAVRALRPFRTG